MRIVLQQRTGEAVLPEMAVEMGDAATVGDLKSEVHVRHAARPPPSAMQLIHSGRLLNDDSKKLVDVLALSYDASDPGREYRLWLLLPKGLAAALASPGSPLLAPVAPAAEPPVVAQAAGGEGGRPEPERRRRERRTPVPPSAPSTPAPMSPLGRSAALTPGGVGSPPLLPAFGTPVGGLPFALPGLAPLALPLPPLSPFASPFAGMGGGGQRAGEGGTGLPPTILETLAAGGGFPFRPPPLPPPPSTPEGAPASHAAVVLAMLAQNEAIQGQIAMLQRQQATLLSAAHLAALAASPSLPPGLAPFSPPPSPFMLPAPGPSPALGSTGGGRARRVREGGRSARSRRAAEEEDGEGGAPPPPSTGAPLDIFALSRGAGASPAHDRERRQRRREAEGGGEGEGGEGEGGGLRRRRHVSRRLEEAWAGAGAGEVEGALPPAAEEAPPAAAPLPPLAPAAPPPPPGLRRFIDLGLMFRLGLLSFMFTQGASPDHQARVALALALVYLLYVGLLTSLLEGGRAALGWVRRCGRPAPPPAEGGAAPPPVLPGGGGGGRRAGPPPPFAPYTALLLLGRGWLLADVGAALSAFLLSLVPTWDADEELRPHYPAPPPAA